LVELIIVIAIMAILAGALAPALIKYINKSRLSTDIQTGQTIATAIQTALSNEAAYDDAGDCTTTALPGAISGASFTSEVTAALGGAIPSTGKSKKDIDGSSFTDQNFYVTIQTATSAVEVYYGGVAPGNMVYPTAGARMTK
jgi:type IV pilus assembly protein PilA